MADIVEENPESPTIMSERFCERNAHILRDCISGKAKNLSAMEYVKNGRQGDYIKCGAIRGRYIVDGKRADHTVGSMSGRTEQRLELRKDCKTNTLTTVQKDNQVVYLREKSKTVRSGGVGSPPDSRHNWDNALDSKVHYRKLTPRECFRLQTVPEHYIDKILSCGVSNTQLYKIAGNGWTDEVIAHIMQCFKVASGGKVS